MWYPRIVAQPHPCPEVKDLPGRQTDPAMPRDGADALDGHAAAVGEVWHAFAVQHGRCDVHHAIALEWQAVEEIGIRRQLEKRSHASCSMILVFVRSAARGIVLARAHPGFVLSDL